MQDGPTPAAGAVVDAETIDRSATLGLDANALLANNDSYTFFKQVDNCLLLPGLTGTNVMDVQIVLVNR